MNRNRNLIFCLSAMLLLLGSTIIYFLSGNPQTRLSAQNGVVLPIAAVDVNDRDASSENETRRPSVWKGGSSNFLRWPDDAVWASWASTGTVPASSESRIRWVLKEIFSGVELPASAHDFGGDGFRLDPKDAEPFYQKLVKAVEYEPRPVLDYWNRELYDEVGVGQGRPNRVTTLQGLVKDEHTFGIGVVPKVDPDNAPPNFPDKLPRYCFEVNPVMGHVIFDDYPLD